MDSSSMYPNTHGIEVIDLAAKIASLAPAYLADGRDGRGDDRIHGLRYAHADARVYVIVADRFVFASRDGFRTIEDVAEVNHESGTPVERGRQWIDTLVESADGTIILFGRDVRDGDARGVVWRKTRGAQGFVRTVALERTWETSKAGNATAGYFGSPPRAMVALTAYASPAHFYFSFDDGLSWRRQDVAEAFALHTHEVLLQPGANAHRTARLWLTGGDDPSGHGSGLVCFDAVGPDGGLSGMRYVLRERPGFRLVGLTGNGKHVYIGNESLAGGALKLQDNLQSIELADFECVLGKSRHDYHQMRSMVATVDGMLVSGTDSYGYVSDSIRADSGGYLYLSNDEGASFREVALGAKWVTGITCDGASFWIAISMGREEGGDLSVDRMTLLRVPKPSPFAELADPYCAKVVVADSNDFYKMAGYPDHPHPVLGVGESTFRVDMSRYRDIALRVETLGAGELAVESLPFYDWHPDEHRWDAVTLLSFTGAERRSIALAGPNSIARHLRVRNVGRDPVRLRQIAFVGKR